MVNVKKVITTKGKKRSEHNEYEITVAVNFTLTFHAYKMMNFIYTIFSLSGYLEQGLLVRDSRKLRQHYFSTSHWRLDILSMLPTDLFYFWWGPNQCSSTRVPCAVIVRINRLFRLPRMWEWFERTETATGYPNAFRICKVSGNLLK